MRFLTRRARRTSRRCVLTGCLLSIALAGCPGNTQGTGDAARDAVDEPMLDATPEAAVFDPGPRPACAVSASAAHLLDRPGGDRVAEPAALVAVAGGFIAGARRIDNDPAAADGGVATPLRDSVELFALGPDGALRGQRTLFDARPAGTQADAPLLFARDGNAFVLFQEIRGNATAPDFLLQLRGASVDANAQGAATTVLRERLSRPSMAPLGDGTLFGIGARIVAVTPGGMVTTEPMAMHVRPDGTDVRPDVSVNAFVPYDLFDAVLRGADDGGARYVYRTNFRLGFLKIRSNGTVDASGPVEVAGSEVTHLDDAVAAGDGVVAVGSRLAGRTAEVRVTVASDQGELRLSRVLETFSLDEGAPAPAAYRGWGGAVLLWMRGAGAAARVRVAVVAPDGRVRLEPTDLVAAPDSYGRVAAVVDGRAVHLLVRDGVVSARWGYTFARGCVAAE